MNDVLKLIQEVLDKGYLLSLATIDNGGVWVADVIYVVDSEYNIYWYSETETRHSKAILANPKVAGTITISNNPGEENIGLQIEGNAEKVEGDILELAIKHRQKRNKPAPTKEGELLEEGESWYRIKPTKIELIYEPLFGFDKKTVKYPL